MSTQRIKAIILQEYFHTLHSMEVALDVIFFPLMSIIVFGFLSVYITSVSNQNVARSLLVGILFWQLVYITQYSVSVGSLWNIWSRNLSNLFTTPLSVKEYLLAHSLSGLAKAIMILILGSLTLAAFFSFDVLSLGVINLLLFFINLSLFAISTGIIILGLIFRFGTRIQAFAWGLLPLFQPLTAAFFPVTVLPPTLRILAYSLPPTYVFEAARQSLVKPGVDWNLALAALGENVLIFAIALIFFHYMFQKSKDTGQFARNEA